jgi:hypothetical protein
MKLSPSKDLIIKLKYDSILIITNRLTKYAYFINYLKALNAKDLVYTFLRIIFVNHNILKMIISNRDKLFILKF